MADIICSRCKMNLDCYCDPCKKRGICLDCLGRGFAVALTKTLNDKIEGLTFTLEKIEGVGVEH